MRNRKSKASRGLVTKSIVYASHARPHVRPLSVKVDVRHGETLDEDQAAAMVAVRTPTPLADVRIIRVVDV